jgi:hypothetical protein
MLNVFIYNAIYMRNIEEWYISTDGDDIAPSWGRMMRGEPGSGGVPPIRVDSSYLGDRILFGCRIYNVRSPLEVTRRVFVEGAGDLNTELRFHDCSGFMVRNSTSPESTRPGNGGNGSRFSGLFLNSIGDVSDPNASGFLIEALCRFEDVYVHHFPRDGFEVNADVNRGTNANHCRFVGCISSDNGRAGFSWRGGDSNICHLTNCISKSNGQYGYLDESFLGTWALGVHAADNGLRHEDDNSGDYYVRGDSQRGVWIIYSEQSAKRSHIYPPNIWMGNPILDLNNARMSISGLRCNNSGLLVGSLTARRPEGRVSITLAPNDPDMTHGYEDIITGQGMVHGIRRSGSQAGLYAFYPMGGSANIPLAYNTGILRAPSGIATNSGKMPVARTTVPRASEGAVGDVVLVIQEGVVRPYQKQDPAGWVLLTWG